MRLANKSRHRMSKVSLQFEHQNMPLIARHR